jgi:hypothetical protein
MLFVCLCLISSVTGKQRVEFEATGAGFSAWVTHMGKAYATKTERW